MIFDVCVCAGGCGLPVLGYNPTGMHCLSKSGEMWTHAMVGCWDVSQQNITDQLIMISLMKRVIELLQMALASGKMSVSLNFANDLI